MGAKLTIKNMVEKPGILKKTGQIFLCALISLASSLFLLGTILYIYFANQLPPLSSLAQFKPKLTTKVLDKDLQTIAEFAIEDRVLMPLTKIPPKVIQAFIAAEDSRFFQHSGINLWGILRAVIKNIQAGSIVQGGSSITQQVAKTFLSPRRTFSRKIKEAILARRIEKNLSKKDILFLYLNQIYLGHGAYGIARAAVRYFSKNLAQLDLAEISLLAGLPRAPTSYSPFNNRQKARERQLYVLTRMLEEKYISPDEYSIAKTKGIKLKPDINRFRTMAPYFSETVRRYIAETYGEKLLYEGGLTVYTTLDMEKQKFAQKALQQGILQLDKRQGYRGPLASIPNIPGQQKNFIDLLKKVNPKKPIKSKYLFGLVKNVKIRYALVTVGHYEGNLPLAGMWWARPVNPELHFEGSRIRDVTRVLKKGDVILVSLTDNADLKKNSLPEYHRIIPKTSKRSRLFKLEQEPGVQGALLSFDPHTSKIKAMVGGYNFEKSEFNRATQACRQPGSAMKPIIYAAALQHTDLTPTSIIVDSPIIYDDPENKHRWTPSNYGHQFAGEVFLRDALINSMNIPSIKVLQKVTIPTAVKFAHKLGITSKLNADLSLALGSSCLTLWELARVYGVFNQLGKDISLHFIEKIVGPQGKVLENNLHFNNFRLTAAEKIGNLYKEIQSKRPQLMDENIAYLTTHLLEGVATVGTGARSNSIGKPVAGKTGTTNDSFDAWFMGFTKDLVTGVWTGYDIYQIPLSRYETGARAALPIWIDYMGNSLQNKPQDKIKPPEGVIMTRIDPKTGLLALPESEEYVVEAFVKGSEPVEYTFQKSTPEPDQFFKMGTVY